jgi:hypothetical protein
MQSLGLIGDATWVHLLSQNGGTGSMWEQSRGDRMHNERSLLVRHSEEWDRQRQGDADFIAQRKDALVRSITDGFQRTRNMQAVFGPLFIEWMNNNAETLKSSKTTEQQQKRDDLDHLDLTLATIYARTRRFQDAEMDKLLRVVQSKKISADFVTLTNNF